jgi:uncharacterized protein YdaT
MPYTKKDYPASMKNLVPEIREKAIDILNGLIEEEKMKIGYAIPTAISRAKDWAAKRNITIPPSSDDDKKPGEDVHVLPHKRGWAVKKDNAERASKVFETKTEAVSGARNMAKENNSSLIIHRKAGTIQSKIVYSK